MTTASFGKPGGPDAPRLVEIEPTVQTHQKVRNVERDPRVALAVCDLADPSRYYAVRGRVIDVTTNGGAEHIEALSQRYLGGPYQWYGGREQIRVILTIAPEKVHAMDR